MDYYSSKPKKDYNSLNDESTDPEEYRVAMDVNNFAVFRCDGCGYWFEFAHFIDGKEYCNECWLRYLPKNRKGPNNKA